MLSHPSHGKCKVKFLQGHIFNQSVQNFVFCVVLFKGNYLRNFVDSLMIHELMNPWPTALWGGPTWNVYNLFSPWRRAQVSWASTVHKRYARGYCKAKSPTKEMNKKNVAPNRSLRGQLGRFQSQKKKRVTLLSLSWEQVMSSDFIFFTALQMSVNDSKGTTSIDFVVTNKF